MFCVDLRTYSYYFPIRHLLTGCCNRDGARFLRGTGFFLFTLGNRALLIKCYLGNFVLNAVTRNFNRLVSSGEAQ